MRGGPRRDEARYGLVCPVCGGRHLRVVYTRGAWGNVVNRCRECQACRSRVTTKEVAAFWQRSEKAGSGQVASGDHPESPDAHRGDADTITSLCTELRSGKI